MSLIGFHRRFALAVFQKFGLAPFRDILPPNVCNEAAHQAHCAPRRERPLIPEVVAWLMMYVGLQTTSMTQGLCRTWGLLRVACPWLHEHCVSEEAFCQAGKQLTLAFWRKLWEHLVSRFEARFAPSLLWKGIFRLLAIGGADVDLPNAPQIARCFGKPRNGKTEGRGPKAKLVTMCSVFTGFCLAFRLIAKPFTEPHALKHLMRYFRRNDLVLMDRGFFPLCGHLAYSPAWGALPHPALRSAGRLGQTAACSR